MGIRVHKVLGYGLTDLKVDQDYELIDERINKNGFLKDGFEDYLLDNKSSVDKFLEFYKNETDDKTDILASDYLLLKMKMDEIKQEKRDTIDITECINHDREFGLHNVMTITPMSMIGGVRSWKRYDDEIDFHEETNEHRQRNRVLKLPAGIFPWIGFYETKSGTKLADDGKVSYNTIAHHFKTTESLENKRGFAELLGYKGIDEAENDIIASIPEEVKMLCKYLKLFNRDDTIYELEPMLYVFWS